MKNIKFDKQVVKMLYELYFIKGIRYLEDENGEMHELQGDVILKKYSKYYGN